MQAGRLFYGVLDMGLGHATRSLSLLRAFLERRWHLWVGSSGRALRVLRQELPGAHFVKLPDYGIVYGRTGAGAAVVLPQVPRLLHRIRAEHIALRNFLEKQPVDLIISDQRYGCWSPHIPSWFLTHQLRFIAPGGLRPLEGFGALWQRFFHRHFSGLIIPDQAHGDGGLLAGRLDRPLRKCHAVHHFGILSSISRHSGIQPDLDVLVSISGPEPQRTLFENRTLVQLADLPGRRAAVLGRPESTVVDNPRPEMTVYAHADRGLMENLLNRSRMIVTRPGYSTLMELAEIGRPALLVPTPGQTEQEYLARRMKKLGWFSWVGQEALDLRRDLITAAAYSGFPSLRSSADNVKSLMDELMVSCRTI